jgi:hypothetical protein
MLTEHVPPGASGVVNEQVLPVMEYRPPILMERASAVICRLAPPVLVMFTTLVTAARGVGIVKFNVVRAPVVVSVPLVAAVKLRVPWIPVPVKVTGEPVTVAPV